MSDNQLTELTKAVQAIGSRITSMDKKFDAMDVKFDVLDKKFDATDDRFSAMEKRFDGQFTKLYKYSQKEFDKIHKRLDQTATMAELNKYVNTVDAYIKRAETYHHEMLALGYKVDRHEKWHHQTAKAVGLKLSA